MTPPPFAPILNGPHRGRLAPTEAATLRLVDDMKAFSTYPSTPFSSVPYTAYELRRIANGKDRWIAYAFVREGTPADAQFDGIRIKRVLRPATRTHPSVVEIEVINTTAKEPPK